MVGAYLYGGQERRLWGGNFWTQTWMILIGMTHLPKTYSQHFYI